MKLTMKKLLIPCALGLLAMLIGGYLGWQKFQPSLPPASITDLKLADIDKQLRRGDEWLGKVVVVNHWATWCPPCREEIPLLIDAQNQFGERGLQVIGIAHDQMNATRTFGDHIGINYPSLVALHDGAQLMRQHGNAHARLPFTAFFDRNGNLVGNKLGAISATELHRAIAPLL